MVFIYFFCLTLVFTLLLFMYYRKQKYLENLELRKVEALELIASQFEFFSVVDR